MKIKSLLKKVSYIFILTLTTSCSSDDDPTDNSSFTTDATTDFFINRDGTVNIMVTGEFEDKSVLTVVDRGFVYGITSNPEVKANNTANALGSNPVNATFSNLVARQTFFIRGYFELSDGTFFYGKEIQTSTDIDASSSRTLVITIDTPTDIQITTTSIIAKVNVTELEKESPTELGCEYSLNSDFSSASVALAIPGNGDFKVSFYNSNLLDLTTNTAYYIRPYAKYADGAITNGGTTTVSVTTD